MINRKIIFIILALFTYINKIQSQIQEIPNLIVWANASNVIIENDTIIAIKNLADTSNNFVKISLNNISVDSNQLQNPLPGLYFLNCSYRAIFPLGLEVSDYTIFCVYFPSLINGFLTDSQSSRFIAPGYLDDSGIVYFRGVNYATDFNFEIIPTYFNALMKEQVEVKINNSLINLNNNSFIQNTINSRLVLGSRFNGSNYFNGYFYEYILFNRELNGDEIIVVETYLNNKYSSKISMQNDTLTNDFCPISISIDNPDDFSSIHWSNGSDSLETIIERAGNYIVSATGQFGFTDYDTIQVFYPGNYLKSFSLCSGQDSIWNTQLNKTDYSFLWQDGSTDSLMVMDEPGEYYCSITSIGGCTYDTDTITFSWNSYTDDAHLPVDPIICSFGILALESGAEETVSYAWYSDDSPNIPISTEASIVPDASQHYWVVALNDIGCEAVDTTLVNFLSGVQAPLAAFSSEALCTGQSSQFYDESTQEGSNIVEWEWTSSDLQSSSLQDPVFSFSEFGEMLVSLKVTNDEGCFAYSQQSIYVNASPEVEVTIQDNLCSNTAIHFQDSSSIAQGSLNEWMWLIDGEMLSSQSPPNQAIFEFNTIGEHELMQVVTSDSGCVSTLDTIFQVRGTPISLFAYDTVCVGTPVSLIALSDTTGAGPVFYEWYSPNGYIGGAEEIDIATGSGTNYGSGGQFSITLVTHTQDAYCSDTLLHYFSLRDLPNIQFIRDQACMGEVTTLSADIDGGDQYFTSWQWELEDNSQGSDPTISFIPSTTGYFSFSFNSSTQFLGCETDILDSVEVFAFPIAFFNGPAEACIDEEIEFQVQIFPEDSSSGLEFDWTLNSNFYSVDTTITPPSQVPGNFDLSLLVSNNGNCESEYSNQFTIFGALVNIEYIQACDNLPTQLLAVPDTLFSGPTTSEWQLENGDLYSGHSLLIDLLDSAWVINTITDTEHNCVNRDSLRVKVSEWPVADFSVPALCEDVTFTIYSYSEEFNDPINETLWLLEDGTEVSGDIFPYSFSDAGMYNLQLIVITEEAHCADTLVQTLEVENSPFVDFSFQPETGQVPLQVEFTNLGDEASNYEWTFANNNGPNVPDPIYTFVDTGWVSIHLNAISSSGCQGEKMDSIYIIPPRIDIEVIEVLPEWDGNFVTIKARVQNNGYYLVNEFESLTSLGLNSPLKKIEQLEIPGAEYRITDPSSSWYVDPKGQAFACVEVSLVDGTKDEVPENDKLCVAISSDRFTVYDPFPNPGTDLLTLRMILPDDGEVSILLYSSEGRMILNNSYTGIEGFNQLELNTSIYSSGSYILKVLYNGKEESFSWVKN